MSEHSANTWCNGRGGTSCHGHTSSFCFPGEAQGLRAPLKVVCVTMVPLERDVNLVSLIGSKTPHSEHCAHRLKQTEKQWCGAGVQTRQEGPAGGDQWAQALRARVWEGKSSAEPILSSCFPTQGSEVHGTSSAILTVCSSAEIQQGDLAMTDTVTYTLRLSGKDGDNVPRPSLRQQMVASQGTGSSLGDYSSWIKASGFVISHRRD